MSRSVPEVLGTARTTDPTRPLVTYYDDATGDRTELSAVTLDNWVAKTANLLVDGHGLGPGDTATVRLPPHWQTAAVLLGCWSAGVDVQPDGQAEVEFVTPDRLDDTEAPDVYVLGLAPLAAPMRPAPPGGFLDYVVAVRGYGDRFTPRDLPDQSALVDRAGARAAAYGLVPGDRVLIDVSRSDDPVDWLLAPLVAGASIVLCGQLNPDAIPGRVTAERITRDLTR